MDGKEIGTTFWGLFPADAETINKLSTTTKLGLKQNKNNSNTDSIHRLIPTKKTSCENC
jgi:hypothetical protein